MNSTEEELLRQQISATNNLATAILRLADAIAGPVYCTSGGNTLAYAVSELARTSLGVQHK